MNKKLFFIFCLFNLYSSFPLSGQRSSENERENSCAIQGRLNNSEVTNIKIDNLQENIPFYILPMDSKGDPRSDIKYFSLIPSDTKEYIKSLKLVRSLDGKDKIEVTYGNQNYVEVLVTRVCGKNEESLVYLLNSDVTISSLEKVQCDGCMVSPRKTRITALQSLEINGLAKPCA